ncbi:MAG: glycosyltransferase family 2 protein [Burkholderiaceae bacterium]|nr:glycosyltransferase family 2 protein [Burkholderiaceae bacterium]MDO9089687.1 glycosyltransferase family 2 protein [Burkholderiaceae bacterium]
MISVIVPVFNEEESLPRLYEQLCAALEPLGQPWEVILVNDGSRDNSAEVLDRLAAIDTRLKVVHFRRNYGQTGAMMAGIDFASGDIIIPIDADLQNDPKDIPRLLAKLDEGYDVVSGWRRDRKDDSLRRNLPSRMANWLISRVSGVKLHDYGCSLKAYRREVIKDVKLYGEMHRFIPIYASWLGARVTEIPVTHHARQFGQSKYGLERIAKVVLDLLVVKFLDRYAQKPIYVFGGFGLLSLVISALVGAWALYLKLFLDVAFIRTPLPLLCVFTAMLGITCILMGLLAELVTRTWFESQGRSTYLIRAKRNLD